MPETEKIGEMLVRELRGLCTTCVLADICVYRRTSNKTIIQCELFQTDDTDHIEAPSGLCRTCDHASRCTLPGRKDGVWHCNEFA